MCYKFSIGFGIAVGITESIHPILSPTACKQWHCSKWNDAFVCYSYSGLQVKHKGGFTDNGKLAVGESHSQRTLLEENSLLRTKTIMLRLLRGEQGLCIESSSLLDTFDPALLFLYSHKSLPYISINSQLIIHTQNIHYPSTFTMAQAFLRELLQAQNRVRPDEDQKCIICLEDCGTINEETGLSETALRIDACGHIVGSGCISVWLRANNTCPLCRHELFPAQPRPHYEHDPREGPISLMYPNEPRTARARILSGSLGGITEYLREMKRRCEIHCNQLRLQQGTAQIALYMLSNMLNPGTSNAVVLDRENVSDEKVVAISVYIATYLTGQPKTPYEVAGAIGHVVRGDSIHGIFSWMIERNELMDDGTRYELEVVFNVRTITWPPRRLPSYGEMVR